MPSLIAEFFKRNVTINLDAEPIVEKPKKKRWGPPPEKTKEPEPYIEPDWPIVASEIEHLKVSLNSGLGGRYDQERLKDLQATWRGKWGRDC